MRSILLRWNARAIPVVAAAALILVTVTDDSPAVEGVAGHSLLSQPDQEVPGESRALCAFCHVPAGEHAEQAAWKYADSGEAKRVRSIVTMGISFPSDEPRGTVGNLSLACLSCHDSISEKFTSAHLGQDNHSLGVPYARGRYSRDAESADVPGFDEDLSAGDGGLQAPTVELVDGAAVWWMETGEPGRQDSDLQLYARVDMEARLVTPYVECTTCHDPHGTQAMYLRIGNEESKLCRNCHRN